MKNLNTVHNRLLVAQSFESAITSSTSNTYVGIGRPLDWTANAVPQPIETTDELNTVFRSLVALKKVNASDINLVIPRIDWANNSSYAEYTEDLETFTYDTLTAISGVSTGTSGSPVLTGNASALFTSNLAVGDFIVMNGDSNTAAPKITKEIVSIANNRSLNVNSSFTATYTNNAVFKRTNTFPRFANSFYVRNSRDQVFKCLANNSVNSTVMPVIALDGQLPENPFIETSDGYKWKYMYTIPSGLKEKFFTADWMPVVSEGIVTTSAENGRLDIFKINSGGTGYQSSGNSNSASILTVSGDGTGANLTANVVNGVIVDINILDSGSGYTTATVVASDATQTAGGATANITVAIGPQGGHGSNAAYELGATNLMVSVGLDADENGTIPTQTSIESFDYRQIILLRNPGSNSGSYLSNTNYSTAYVVSVTSPPAGVHFDLDENVYQGTSLANSNFSGTVVNWKSSSNELWLNNVSGTFVNSAPLVGTTQTSAVTAFTLTEPDWEPYTGEVLYIENRDKVVRDPYQTEQIKLVLSF